MREIQSVSERIRDYDELLESMAQNKYPEAERLKQIKGVGTLIALTYMLTLEDPSRFRKSRDAACYVGLQPGRRNSGQSEPQMRISKEGEPYLRALLVQAAHHILGPWGVDSDLRRWGMKLAEHGGKRGKKRATIAVARKLAVLLHRLWVSGDVYVPLRRIGSTGLPPVARKKRSERLSGLCTKLVMCSRPSNESGDCWGIAAALGLRHSPLCAVN